MVSLFRFYFLKSSFNYNLQFITCLFLVFSVTFSMQTLVHLETFIIIIIIVGTGNVDADLINKISQFYILKVIRFLAFLFRQIMRQSLITGLLYLLLLLLFSFLLTNHLLIIKKDI